MSENTIVDGRAGRSSQQWSESSSRADLVIRFNLVMGDPDPIMAESQENFVAGNMREYELISLARLYDFLMNAAEQG